MAERENTKTLTTHLDDVSMRIVQARAVLRSLSENMTQEGSGIRFGDTLSFTEVANTFWAVDSLLDQASAYCGDGYSAACMQLRKG